MFRRRRSSTTRASGGRTTRRRNGSSTRSAQVQELTARFRAGNYDSLNNADTITVITGDARFVDPHTVAVGNGADQLTITADTILINTGSEPVIADVPGLADSSRLVTNVDLIKNTTLPGRLAVIGGGYLGIEFASMYHRFGSQVSVFEASARILGREDDDVASAAAKILTDEGVDIVAGATVLEVRDGANDTTITYEKNGRRHTLVADAVLAATGRTPVTEGLELAKAGIRTTERGAIEVDEHLRTSQPHIFALGDVNGGPQFTYISLDDSRIVLDQLIGEGKRTTTDRVAVPATLFMTPPLATVGLTEKQARAEGHQVKIARQNVADIVAMPRADIVEETRGLMKFVIDAGHRPDPRRRPTQRRRPGAHQHRHPRNATRHHRHRTPRLHLHPPKFHRSLQRRTGHHPDGPLTPPGIRAIR